MTEKFTTRLKRPKLTMKEFEFDAEVRRYREMIEKHDKGTEQLSLSAHSVATLGLEMAEQRLKNVQLELYGWRHFSDALALPKIQLIKEKILEIEEKEAKYQGVISDYQSRVSDLEAQIKVWAADIDNAEKVREIKEELLTVHGDFSIAEIGLPMVKEELEEVPITTPEVVKYLSGTIEEALEEIKAGKSAAL